jgi:DNA helicase II / ATP-dependent DNA helicase PcrA
MNRSATPPTVDDAIFAGLNEEQLQAVHHGDGPVLLVAGAGTGKTRVITRRIAWLIQTGRARPDQILALTFTDKAARELEERVDVLVPFGMTGAWMSTFNAFGDRLVREHAIELGLTSQLRVESRAEILVFLREHLFELGLERYLPLGNPEQHLQALMGLFDRARDEDVSPEDYLAFAARLADEAGDDAELRDRAVAEREKARAYAAYHRLLLEHGRVDFGHQISLALRLLRERPYLRREYQDRFRYVLVDEFQDTNYVQFELVKLLCGPGANLTVVGDDDQSIYRFRGARVENLLEFKDAYPGAREILLIRNYRSGQSILDAAHRLIQHNNPARLEAIHHYDKRLLSQIEAPGELRHALYATASDEADAVAEEIAANLGSGALQPRDHAILARAHSHLEPFAAALKAHGIRFHRTNTRGLYARAEIQLCLNVMRALADPDDGAALYYALADPLFGVDPVDLARLGARARRHHRGLLGLAEAALGDPEPWLADASREALERFIVLFHRLSVTASRRPTSEVLYEFATESGLLSRLTAAETAEALEQVQNLNKLFGIVTRVGPLLMHDRVDQFIQHLDLLIDAGDDPAAAEVELEDNAVHLLTAHNAKGLEFPVVFMVQLVEQKFPGSNRPEALPLPPELRRRGGASETVDNEREERRLFYVGMTRAQHVLVLTSAVDYGGKRSRKTSRFVREALGLEPPVKGAAGASPREAIARYAPPVSAPAPELAPIPDGVTLELSQKQISTYLTCPLKYKFEHVMHVPLPGHPQLMYGNAVHNALRVFFQHRMKGLPIEVDAVLGVFDAAWSSAGFHSREHEERMHEKGHAILRRYIERALREKSQTIAVEMAFSFRRGHNQVEGRFDRIDEGSDGVALIDYKTTDLTDPEKADARVKEDLLDGQLGLYALAYQETRGTLPARAELHFVAPGFIASRPVEATHAERAADRIDRAAAGIRARDFTPLPDPFICRHCDFARYCAYSAVKVAP